MFLERPERPERSAFCMHQTSWLLQYCKGLAKNNASLFSDIQRLV